MYSRSFSDKSGSLPPHYGGTAFGRRKCEDHCHEEHREECREPPPSPCPAEQKIHTHPHEEPPCRDERPREECPPKEATGCERAASGFPLFRHLLPEWIGGEELLLLATAFLLLVDGCDDGILPWILLFLLAVK